MDWLVIKRPGVSGNGSGNYGARSEAGDSFDEFCRNNEQSRSIDSNDLINDSTISIIEADEEAVPPADKLYSSHSVPASADEISSFTEYEGIVLAGFPRRPGLAETLGTTADIALKKTAIEELSTNVFLDKDEAFHRMVKGFTGFKYGQLHAIFLLLTDKAVYFLRKRTNGSFSNENVVSFRDLMHIEIGLNCQTLAFHARVEKFSLSTGNEAVTRGLISDISSLVVKRLSSPAQLTRLVSSAAVQGEASIKMWLRHALKNQVRSSGWDISMWLKLTVPGL